MFEIDSKDVKILDLIGKGGSSAFVYSALWNNQKVAYKVFDVREYLDENKFQEFETEVEMLASISFPFLLTFFGATLNLQRLGFVMEFAENECYMKLVRQSVLMFLHNKNIIHRDLKPLNVLVTSKEETKLMDFGFSKIIDGDLTKTKAVGTSFYIAPEVVNGKYSFPCDVFSFSMLMFVVLTENFSPFGKNKEFQIFNQISNNPKFRPKIKEFDKSVKKQTKIDEKKVQKIKEMIVRNWNHEQAKRMKFSEISKLLIQTLENKKN